jgi:hypothetical protein
MTPTGFEFLVFGQGDDGDEWREDMSILEDPVQAGVSRNLEGASDACVRILGSVLEVSGARCSISLDLGLDKGRESRFAFCEHPMAAFGETPAPLNFLELSVTDSFCC